MKKIKLFSGLLLSACLATMPAGQLMAQSGGGTGGAAAGGGASAGATPGGLGGMGGAQGGVGATTGVPGGLGGFGGARTGVGVETGVGGGVGGMGGARGGVGVGTGTGQTYGEIVGGAQNRRIDPRQSSTFQQNLDRRGQTFRGDARGLPADDPFAGRGRRAEGGAFGQYDAFGDRSLDLSQHFDAPQQRGFDRQQDAIERRRFYQQQALERSSTGANDPRYDTRQDRINDRYDQARDRWDDRYDRFRDRFAEGYDTRYDPRLDPLKYRDGDDLNSTRTTSRGFIDAPGVFVDDGYYGAGVAADGYWRNTESAVQTQVTPSFPRYPEPAQPRFQQPERLRMQVAENPDAFPDEEAREQSRIRAVHSADANRGRQAHHVLNERFPDDEEAKEAARRIDARLDPRAR